jgi:hypothetical protein
VVVERADREDIPTGLAIQAALLLSMGVGPINWQEGRAVRYAPKVMDRVAFNRGIAPAPCMVAWTHAQARDMGETWLTIEGVRTGVRRRCLVVDLPQPQHKPGLVARGIVVELDYSSSKQICPPGWEGAARLCKVRVSR